MTLGAIQQVWSKTDLHQPAAHRIVSGAQAGEHNELTTLRILRAPRLKITGLSGVSPDCPVSPRATVIFANGQLPRD